MLFSPMNPATKASRGCVYSMSGVPCCIDPPVVKNRDAIGHRQCLALVVRDIDNGQAKPFVQQLDLDLQLLTQLLVERPKRLVHQHQARLEHQRARQGDALLLSTRELRGAATQRMPPAVPSPRRASRDRQRRRVTRGGR